jgi:glycosyltransferase involved in cell wall biosynthesis
MIRACSREPPAAAETGAIDSELVSVAKLDVACMNHDSLFVPLVSIVLPTHNGAKYIKQAVESCLGQTYRNVELIIVDDASTDETHEIVSAFADPRITNIRNERNLKLPASLNVGFARARGEFLTWTSDDNYYASDAIGRMVAFLTANKADFVCCDYYRIDESTPSAPVVVARVNPQALDNNGVGPCFLYSRMVYAAIGAYDPDTLLLEDYDYWLRVRRRFQMHRLPETLYYYRLHEKSLTSQYYLQNEEGGIVFALVRIKNQVESAKRECDKLALNAASFRYARMSFFLKAIGQLVSIASFGKVTVPRIMAFHKRPELWRVLEAFESGEIGLLDARTRIRDVLVSAKRPAHL